MGMLDFLKPKGVPDVGKEQQYDSENDKSKNLKKLKEMSSKPEGEPEAVEDESVQEEPEAVEEESVEEPEAVESVEEEIEVPKPSKKKAKKTSSDFAFVQEENKIAFEKLTARIEALDARMGQLSERFSYLSENIGEVRNMNLENEKRISKATREAEKVIDVVKEVKPEKLRIEYQKSDMKVKELGERINANKLFMESVLEEVKDLKRKSEIFVGAEGLMKLNEDTKKDLVEQQKINARVKLNADKAQEIFMEIKKGFAESQKVNAIINDLNETYSDLKDQIGKLTLRYGKVVSLDDFADYKKSINSKLADFTSALGRMSDLRNQNSKAAEIAETALSVAKRNEEDIGELAIKIGHDGVKKVADFENDISSILEILDSLAEQMAQVRKKLKLKGKKVKLKLPEKKLVEKEKPFKVDEKGIPDVEGGSSDDLNASGGSSVDEALESIPAVEGTSGKEEKKPEEKNEGKSALEAYGLGEKQGEEASGEESPGDKGGEGEEVESVVKKVKKRFKKKVSSKKSKKAEKKRSVKQSLKRKSVRNAVSKKAAKKKPTKKKAVKKKSSKR